VDGDVAGLPHVQPEAIPARPLLRFRRGNKATPPGPETTYGTLPMISCSSWANISAPPQAPPARDELQAIQEHIDRRPADARLPAAA
jgi:hypothetical protein